MRLLGLDWRFPIYTRNKSGSNFYDITAYNKWAKSQDNLAVAQNHPILTPALLFVSKLFSQAQFTVVRESTGKGFENSKVLGLLKNPNVYLRVLDD